jgi:hypothetical protein
VTATAVTDSEGVLATATAASGDGRFAFFDADRAEPAPDEPPFDAWLEAMGRRGLAVPWTAPAPGPRRLRVRWADADAEAAGTDWQRLELPSGRLCIAGLDEAFAARHAELHPGAFGDIVELAPGAYELRVEPAPPAPPAAVPAAADAEASGTRMLRPGDELVARLVQGGLPLVVVAGMVLAATAVVALTWSTRIAWFVLVAAVVAWAILVRIGVMPPLRRVAEVRRVIAETHPDAVLVLRPAAGSAAIDSGGEPVGGPEASVDTVNPTGSRSPGLGISSTHRTLPPPDPA